MPSNVMHFIRCTKNLTLRTYISLSWPKTLAQFTFQAVATKNYFGGKGSVGNAWHKIIAN